ncbi:RNA polymerase sigma24 factor [Catellatospora sp. TT07R-123]|uniref:SigE family RNA polymerase sigma factor n=1 Tax=Catellatospora sp. TT07R-123 TaxID=2733863 RepID=UPI001B0A9FB5|nr:SigE family RNA polymerase sigma factor [Catellatospora sp. TT07R-123]GHJ44471.1 RNA polymerase sigma24 factor [Catellatospora sp. TT07R-123]
MSQEEFTAYFAARSGLVRRSAYVLCGDWHAADDLAQEAFIRLAGSWHRMRDPAAVDAYMRTCLVRSYLREQRRSWRRHEDTVGDLPDAPDAAGLEDDRLQRLALVRALRSVPPRQRAALVCRYLWDLDVADTARILGCSTGTVKSQTARALDHLKAAGWERLTSDEGAP